MKPIAILVHVPDVNLGLKWYQKAFPMAVKTYLSGVDFTVLNVDDFSLEIVQSDEKVGAGKYGTVLYWYVEDMDKSLAHFYSIGAKLYRGPKAIENSLIMCQIEDPFGNLIGLRAKAISAL